MTDRRELRLRERIDTLLEERNEARGSAEALTNELDMMRGEVAALSKRCAKLERELDEARLKAQRRHQRYHEVVNGRDYWRKRALENSYHANLHRQMWYQRRKKASRGAPFTA